MLQTYKVSSNYLRIIEVNQMMPQTSKVYSIYDSNERRIIKLCFKPQSIIKQCFILMQFHQTTLRILEV